LFDDLHRSQARAYKIVSLFTAVNCNRYDRKQQHAEEESGKKFL
jgi:hypothetical protein